MSRRTPSNEGSEQERIRKVNDAMSQLVGMTTGYNPPSAEYELAKRAANGDSNARDALQRQLETLYLVARHAQGKHEMSATPAYAETKVQQLDDVIDEPSKPVRRSAQDLERHVENAASELDLDLSV